MSISQTFTSQSVNKFRETLFPSYLNEAEETFVLDHVCLRRRRSEDKDIDVFDAEKYFKEGVDNSPKSPNKDLPNTPFKKDETLEIFSMKEKPRIITPSIHSELSSNSRSAFLHTFPRNHQPKKSNKKSFLATIGCSCSCNDKNSIETEDFTPENGNSKQLDKTNDHLIQKSLPEYSFEKFNTQELRQNSDNHFSFPVFNPKNGSNQATKMNPPEVDTGKRKSLEVFGSPILETGKSSLTLEKKLTMLSWDTITPRKHEELTIPSISSDLHNNSDSDSISDLFEIESLSNCITPTTCYAPSEISIEWSVVTASAADFSAMSDSDEFKSTAGEYQKTGLNSKPGPVKEMNKRRLNIISGCKSQKAVRVAGDAHKGSEKGVYNTKKLDKSEIFTPTTQFHSEIKEEGFDSRNMKQTFDAARLLYT